MSANNPLSAFDNCPNRSTEIKSIYGSTVELTCPKYPDATDMMPSSEFDDNAYRSQAARRIGCAGCRYSSVEYDAAKNEGLLERLHPKIVEHSGGLFVSEHYFEATVTGYKVVRDRLRELTGYEKATDAFGRGGLYINGSAGEHVDGDFQKAAQFLMMAGDMFRNEGTHTSHHSGITGSDLAYQHLNVSSLSMHYLDSAVVR